MPYQLDCAYDVAEGCGAAGEAICGWGHGGGDDSDEGDDNGGGGGAGDVDGDAYWSWLDDVDSSIYLPSINHSLLHWRHPGHHP